MLALCLMLSTTYYAQNYTDIIGLGISIVQASSSFKCFDAHTFIYSTPTFITEVHCLVTQVQLSLLTVTVN